MLRIVFGLWLWGIFILIIFGEATAHAQRLSTEAEVKLVTGVNFTPQTVALVNTYISAVPVCTYNLPSTTSPTVIPRVTNITSTSFSLSIQSMPNTNAGVSGDVHCLIVEEGTHTLPDGTQFQGITQFVSNVSGIGTTDSTFLNNSVDISSQISTGFSNPIVLGAVISSNDTRATAFHTNNCTNRGVEPFSSGVADGICVGRHIGQQSDDPVYAGETVGAIIIDPGTGMAGVFGYEIGRGPNAIDGVRQNGNTYTVGGDFEIGVATQVGENGGQGGWAVLLGADPLSNNQLSLAIEEEIVAGDTFRGHIDEVVDYWLFNILPTPELSADKMVEVFDPLDEGLFALPGNDVLYTISLQNTGAGVVDNDSLFFVDTLPLEVVFFNGDADGPGPETDAVIFQDNGSGLSFNSATDVAYATISPSSFADCSHPAAPGFDPDIRFICFRPQGEMAAGMPAPSFTLTFRARLQ